MVRHLYPDYRERNRALGIWAAVSGFSLALGPVIGGALVYTFSWHAVFWFDVAFGLVALAAAAVALPENADTGAGGFDIPGAIFGTAALRTSIFPLMDARGSGYRSPFGIPFLGTHSPS